MSTNTLPLNVEKRVEGGRYSVKEKMKIYAEVFAVDSTAYVQDAGGNYRETHPNMGEGTTVEFTVDSGETVYFIRVLVKTAPAE